MLNNVLLSMQTAYTIIQYVSKFVSLAFVLSLHEFGHAIIALKNGDDTAKLNGRCTINPFAHFDIFGLLCFMFVGFGWAKPVPINPNNFKKTRKGLIEVSIAGVSFNYVLAFIAYPLLLLCINMQDLMLFDDFLYFTLYFMYLFSLSFCVFNLLPLYPLDGYNFLRSAVKRRSRVLEFLGRYGEYILFGLLIIHYLSDRVYVLSYVDLLGIILSFAQSVLSIPITWFWGLIFND